MWYALCWNIRKLHISIKLTCLYCSILAVSEWSGQLVCCIMLSKCGCVAVSPGITWMTASVPTRLYASDQKQLRVLVSTSLPDSSRYRCRTVHRGTVYSVQQRQTFTSSVVAFSNCTLVASPMLRNLTRVWIPSRRCWWMPRWRPRCPAPWWEPHHRRLRVTWRPTSRPISLRWYNLTFGGSSRRMRDPTAVLAEMFHGLLARDYAADLAVTVDTGGQEVQVVVHGLHHVAAKTTRATLRWRAIVDLHATTKTPAGYHGTPRPLILGDILRRPTTIVGQRRPPEPRHLLGNARWVCRQSGRPASTRGQSWCRLHWRSCPSLINTTDIIADTDVLGRRRTVMYTVLPTDVDNVDERTAALIISKLTLLDVRYYKQWTNYYYWSAETATVGELQSYWEIGPSWLPLMLWHCFCGKKSILYC